MTSLATKRWSNEVIGLHRVLTDPEVDSGIRKIDFTAAKRQEMQAQGNFQTFSIFRDLNELPCAFEVLMEGPADSPYADRLFPFEVSVSKDYPVKAPIFKCTFPFDYKTLPKHFFLNGSICCHALTDDYSPCRSIVYLLNAIREVMFEPTSVKSSSISVEEIQNYEKMQEQKRADLHLLTY